MPLNIDWQQILLHAFNFVLLFAILFFFLYSPVKKFMKKRNDGYKEREEKTKKELSEATEKNEKAEERLKNLDEEIEEAREKANARIAAESKKARADAEREAEEIVSAAKARTEGLRKQALEDGKRELASLVEEAAQSVIAGQSAEASFDSFLENAEKSVQGEDDGNGKDITE